MIENPYPTEWRQLQAGVCQLFNEIGLSAETEKKFQTPRGEVEIDVYAVDEKSVDKIRYLVECKNWSSAIPQHVVHSFTTVMHETGGNLGFIVSKEGLQSGAERYTQSTNIIGLTFQELQQRYFEVWWRSYFTLFVMSAADDLIQYVEPINSRRERFRARLSRQKQKQLNYLEKKYQQFGMILAFTGAPLIFSKSGNAPARDIIVFKDSFSRTLGDEFTLSSSYFRELAGELALKARSVTDEFHEVFGKNIFAE